MVAVAVAVVVAVGVVRMKARHETLTSALRDLYFAGIARGDGDVAALAAATRQVIGAAERWHLEPADLTLAPETLEVMLRPRQ